MDTRALHELMRQKITKVVFEQMFREAGTYTVVPLRTDETSDALLPHRRHSYIRKILENLKAAPDFALISQDKTDVLVVEVAYTKKADSVWFADAAHSILRRWDPAYIFLATENGFYFESCAAVRKGNGSIKHLSERWIRRDIQDKYLDLLQDYIR